MNETMDLYVGSRVVSQARLSRVRVLACKSRVVGATILMYPLPLP